MRRIAMIPLGALLAACPAVEAPENQPPTAEAGIDQRVDEETAVELLGSGEDEDGSIARYAWTQLGGPEVALSDADAAVARFTAPVTRAEVELLFELTVTDDQLASATDSVRVLVAPVNEAPVADAGEDREVDEETPVTLSGTADDVDGEVAEIAWEQTAGPEVSLDAPDALDPTFTAPTLEEETELTFRLEVLDDEGASAQDEVVITVRPVNAPPIVDAGEDRQVDEQTEVSLPGSAEDPDGQLVRTTWTQTAGPEATLSDPAALTVTFTAPTLVAAAELRFTLSAEDDEGGTAEDEVVVLVEPVNAPPTADAGPDTQADEQTEVPLFGVGVDSDGTIASIAWAQLSGPAGSFGDPAAAATTYTTGVTTTVQVAVLELTVTDDEGATATDTRSITVHPVNAPPTADAGGDQAGLVGELVTLAGSGSDPDGAVVSYAWSQLAGPSASLPGTGGASVSFTAPAVTFQEVLVFELTVTDDEGGSDTDTVEVRVSDAAAVLPLGATLDFDQDDGDLSTPGTLWEHGAPTSGPGAAHSPSMAWATNLAGNYPDGAEEFLNLPLLDLTAATDPTLSFRLWATSWGAGDGAAVEAYEPSAGWVPLPAAIPAYDTVAGGVPSWGEQHYRDEYVFAAIDLGAYAGSQVFVRFAFRSNATLAAAGTYLDDLSLFDESDDPDGDGVPGVLDELLLLGTDPFEADSDGDGASDGAEQGLTDPLDPADYPGGPLLSPDALLPLSGSDGGLATSGSLWDHGTVTSGPGHGHTGSQAWATNPAGAYFADAVEHLHLPPLDLTGATDPTLSFRLWMAAWGGGDGVQLGIKPAGGSWTVLSPDTPAYNGSAVGPIWEALGYQDQYVFGAASLAPWAGQQVQVRFTFLSSPTLNAAGAYLDDIALTEEAADPDGDGIAGVLDEYLAHGTDPFVADSDGDGALDGAELTAGTEPLNPADFPGAVPLVPGDLLDFELGDDGGLAALGTLWEHGTPAGGPGAGSSGSSVWATNLQGNYFGDAVESVYLPPVDLTAASAPVLRFSFWQSVWGGGDGLSVEVDSPAGRLLLLPSAPSYNGSAGGYQAWTGNWGWTTAELPLSGWAGSTVNLRLTWRSSATLNAAGAYVDDLQIVD